MSESSGAHETDETRRTIRKFVLEQFPLARRQPLEDDQDLLDSGIVDSLGILEIVQFLTETFGIEIADEDLDPENFGSIHGIAMFVARKHG